MNQVSDKLRELLDPPKDVWSGFLGDFEGNVEGERSGEKLVRVRQAGSDSYVVGSFPTRIALRNWVGLPVWISRDPLTGEQYISGVDAVMLNYGDSGFDEGFAQMPLHSRTQEWRVDADDMLLWLNSQQIFPLRVQPATSKHVVVQAGVFFAGGKIAWNRNSVDVDLSSYYPSSGSAWVMVCIDKNIAVTVIQDGVGGDALNVENLGPIPLGSIALAAVKLTVGAEIEWLNADSGDVRDLRFIPQFDSSVLGGDIIIQDGAIVLDVDISHPYPSESGQWTGLISKEVASKEFIGVLGAFDTDIFGLGLLNEGADRKDTVLLFGDNVTDSLIFYRLEWTTRTLVQILKIEGNGNITTVTGAVLGKIGEFTLDTTHSVTGHVGGRVSWNANDYTANIESGLGPTLQIGQELFTVVYNDTGSEIENGTAVYPVGAVGGNPSIAEADATTHVTIAGVILITTMDIPDESIGLAVRDLGKVRGVNTTGFSLGNTVWIAAGATGVLNNITNVKPEFPNYPVQVGGISVVDVANGVIEIAVKGEAVDTIRNFWNGVFRESFDFLVTSDGTVVTGSLSPSNGHDDMTMMFSDGFTMLDTNPPSSITLTPGTDEYPQTNYVYIPRSTKVLTVSTSSWPTTIEHIRVAQIALKSAATVKLRGVSRNQNWNDHIEDTRTFQGHLSHIGAKLRQFHAQWDSGAEASVVVGAGGLNVYVKNTAGIVFQMHPQNFPIIDMTPYTIDAVSQGSKTFTVSGDGDLTNVFPDARLIQVKSSTGNDGLYTIVSTVWSDPDFVITVLESIPSAVADGEIGDDIDVVNDYATRYLSADSLTDITTDASGGSLTNSSFSIVVWGVSNKTGETSHLMANMPLGTYNKNFPEQAVQDADSATVYTIPKQYAGVGFLMARFTFVNTGGSWSLYQTQDLRGFVPNSTAGSGAGASGVTTFLGLTDTPNTYVGAGEQYVQVNTSETALEFTELPALPGGELLFAPDDLLLLGPGCSQTPSGWTSLRGQVATLTGAFHQEAGRWAVTRALMVEEEKSNILPNPIDGYAGWGSGSTTTHGNYTSDFLFGNRCMYAASNATSIDIVVFEILSIGLVGGEAWTLSCFIKPIDAGLIGETVRLTIRETGGAVASEDHNEDFTLQAGWQRYVSTATITQADRTGIVALFYIISADVIGETVLFDGAQLEQGAYATSICWGDHDSGYSWGGTPNSSTSVRVATELNLDDYVSLISGNAVWSLSLWWQPQYAYNAAWPSDAFLFDTRGASDSHRVYIKYDVTFSGYRIMLNGTQFTTSSLLSFGAGEWQHLVFTLDYTNDDYIVYANGNARILSHTDSAPTLTEMNLGSDYAGTNPANAAYAEFVLFDRELTSDDVDVLFVSAHALTDQGAIDAPVDNLGPLAAVWGCLHTVQTHTGDATYTEAGSNQESRFGFGTWVSGTFQFEAVLKVSDSADTAFAKLQWDDSGTWRDVANSEVSLTGTTSADLVRSSGFYLSPIEREYRVVIRTSDSAQTVSIYKAVLICTPGGLSEI